jgi:hypothetical protein
MAVAESVKRQLRHGKSGFIVAECGSADKNRAPRWRPYRTRAGAESFYIVLCPSHVAKKWSGDRRIAAGYDGVVVRGITEFDKLYALYERGNKSVYAVISKKRRGTGI